MPEPPRQLFTMLSRALEGAVRDGNPWWRGEQLYGLPSMRRWLFTPLLTGLKSGLAPVQVLRGPRQVGKTTLLNQIVSELLASNVQPHRILRVQFDELPSLKDVETPVLEIARWFSENILKKGFHEAAAAGEQAYILLYEVQNLPDWAPQLKHLADMNPVRALVTGSSALRIEAGRDSLAGRVTTFDLGPLLLREIGELRDLGAIDPFLPPNGIAPLKEKRTWLDLRAFGAGCAELRHAAFEAFSERGAYPVAQSRFQEPFESMTAFLNETVVQRVIQHDLRMGPREQKRDEHLLEEVFRLACRYLGQAPGQALYLDEIRKAMNANIGWQRVLKYLKFLDGTLLIRLIEPPELRLKKQKGTPKVCLCDHILRAAWLHETVPLSARQLEIHSHLADLAGHVAESTAGYFLRSLRGIDVAHFPERGVEPEVDFVVTIGEQRIPVEVKYRRRIEYKDTAGLRSFLEKTHYNAPFGVLVTLRDDAATEDPRIVSIPLSSLHLLR